MCFLYRRYATIRYNSVDESISAYKQAHDLMWDTRSVIVRFRRYRGSTCLPGDTKNPDSKNPDVKRIKEELNNAQVKNEKTANGTDARSKNLKEAENSDGQIKREGKVTQMEQNTNNNEAKSAKLKEDNDRQGKKEDKIARAVKLLTSNKDTCSAEARFQGASSEAQNKSIPQADENSHSSSPPPPTSITSAKTIQEQQQPWVRYKVIMYRYVSQLEIKTLIQL